MYVINLFMNIQDVQIYQTKPAAAHHLMSHLYSSLEL